MASETPTGHEARCGACGAVLGSDAHGGFCPRCVFDRLARVHAMDHPSELATPPDAEAGDGADAGDAESGGQGRLRSGTRIGPYELHEEIGRGGMGILFKATQLSLGRTVAIKLLLAGHFADAGFIRRFRTEATSAGMLQHPNIAGIHEIGIYQGQHYIAMDYVAGKDLAGLCAGQPLPIRRAAGYVKTIAEAIHFAHDRGVLHRDLKPANIVLDPNDQPQITDFGLATKLDEDAAAGGNTYFSVGPTVPGQLLGSPNYMPPEQAAPEMGKVGRQSDIYSLGAILFHLLTGRPPFVGETLSGILRQVIETEPSSPRTVNPGVPRDLETICLKCLQKKPAHRYATARDLADDLELFLQDRPIHARPVSQRERVFRYCRRNPGLSFACTFLLLLLLVIAVGSPIAAFRINKERLRAEEQRERAVRSEAESRDSLYAARMNLAQQAWEHSNIGVLRSLLNETKSHPERGFEWYYWFGKQSQELRTIHTPGKNVDPSFIAVAISPDGASVLGYASGTVRMWNLSTGRRVLKLDGEYPVISPDGKQFVVGKKQSAILWNRADEAVEFEFLGHSGALRGTAFSPDGSEVATWADDDTIRTWNPRDGRQRARIDGIDGPIAALAYTAGGRHLVAVGVNGTVRTWDSRSGAESEEAWEFNRGDEPDRTAAFSRDARLIVTAGVDRNARAWDRATRKEIAVFVGHTARVVSAVFSPDGEQVLTVSQDQTARLWDLSTGRELRKFVGHERWVMSAAFSPAGDRIVTGGRDGNVKVWSVKGSRDSCLSTGLPGRAPTAFGSFSPDGKRIATAGVDHSVQLWDVGHEKPIFNFTRHQMPVQMAIFSPDGEKF